MRARPLLRSMLVAGLLCAAPGCFVGEEIDKASALDNSHATGGGNKPRTAPGAAAAGAAKPGAAKPAAGAKAAAPATPTAKGWWQTARTLGSEQSDEEITSCEINGGVEFMLRDDCLTRGGVPK